ncbi:MAG: 3-hexulose-6-phosphate synthase [Nanoarchaeota archaeon]
MKKKKKIKLQIALDVIDAKKALNICKKIQNYIDIIEIGTPLVKSNGLRIVKKFKKFKKFILLDLKTMDTGFLESEIAFNSGVDVTTVCASSNIETIKQSIKAARKYNKKVLVDLINIKDVEKKTRELLKLENVPDYICVHTGIDMQNKGKRPLEDLKKVSEILKNKNQNKNKKKQKKPKLAVAGGINLENLKEVKKYFPEIIIVGGAITKSQNPEEIARKLKEIIEN